MNDKHDEAARLLMDLYRQAPEMPESQLAAMVLDPETHLRQIGAWREFEPFRPDDADWFERLGRALLNAHRDANLDEDARRHQQRIRRNFERLDSDPPAEQPPEEELPY